MFFGVVGVFFGIVGVFLAYLVYFLAYLVFFGVLCVFLVEHGPTLHQQTDRYHKIDREKPFCFVLGKISCICFQPAFEGALDHLKLEQT